jgi:hypothetical protein
MSTTRGQLAPEISPAATDFVPPHLEAPARPAVEPPREVHLHLTVSPDQLAAIMRHHTGDQ